ncbi:MAG: hypothetical protein LC650_01935 [Actinobacteria bacterium]|nr:hypothetical protein [Actinomycetota bacterium]
MSNGDTRVELRVKRRDGAHWVTEDKYHGNVDGAFTLLHDKYLKAGWVQRFEKRFVEELEEYNARLR